VCSIGWRVGDHIVWSIQLQGEKRDWNSEKTDAFTGGFWLILRLFFGLILFSISSVLIVIPSVPGLVVASVSGISSQVSEKQ
jgi:hypothetical protein